MKRQKIIHKKIRMYLSLILLLLATFHFPNSSLSHSRLNKKTKENLSIINKKLEVIEINLRISNYDIACKEALKSAKLIQENKKNLSMIEPSYNWVEIKNVLLKIAIDHCPGKTKEQELT